MTKWRKVEENSRKVLLSVGCLFKKKKFLVHMHMLRLLSFEYKGIIVKLAWVKEGIRKVGGEENRNNRHDTNLLPERELSCLSSKKKREMYNDQHPWQHQ